MRSTSHRVWAGLVLACTSSVFAAGDQQAPPSGWTSPQVWSQPAVAYRPGRAPAEEPAAVEALGPLATSPSAPFFFVALLPCRVVDTRVTSGFGGAYGPPSLPQGATRDFTLVGQCGIPQTAQAVSVNITVTNTLGPGFIAAWPQSEAYPGVSNLNYMAGDTLANSAVIALGTSGAISVVAGVSGADLIIDVNGYYTSGDRNPTANSAGAAVAIRAQGASVGATDKAGGDLLLGGGPGTGLGASGNVRIQTAGADAVSGTTDDVTVDRRIVVAKAKALTLSTPGFTSLMSIHLTGTHTAGGRIFYTVRATDGASQVVTESGVIQYLATPNSITCTVQSTDKLHLGTVNSGCTPGFFNPGSQPGISIFDNVSFSSPAPIVEHEVYFTIENESGSPIRLEP